MGFDMHRVPSVRREPWRVRRYNHAHNASSVAEHPGGGRADAIAPASPRGTLH
jgi:hypothetical protein